MKRVFQAEETASATRHPRLEGGSVGPSQQEVKRTIAHRKLSGGFTLTKTYFAFTLICA